MNVMKNTFYLAFAILTSLLPARGEMITQTVDFGTLTGESQLYFSKFDSSLGTLTDVTLSWTINSTISTAQITNQNAGNVTVSRITFSNTVEGYVPSVGDTGYLAAEVSKSKSVTPGGGSVTLTPGQTYTINNVVFSGFTQTDSYASGDAEFDSFSGTGNVPFYLANTFGATPTASGSGSTTSWLTSITGSSTGNLVVAYTYTAAPIAPVPEPHSIALGFVGLLFVAGFATRSRGSFKEPNKVA